MSFSREGFRALANRLIGVTAADFNTPVTFNVAGEWDYSTQSNTSTSFVLNRAIVLDVNKSDILPNDDVQLTDKRIIAEFDTNNEINTDNTTCTINGVEHSIIRYNPVLEVYNEIFVRIL